jgi:hypothetical protein
MKDVVIVDSDSENDEIRSLHSDSEKEFDPEYDFSDNEEETSSLFGEQGPLASMFPSQKASGVDVESKEFKKFVRGLKKQLVELKEKLTHVNDKVGSGEVANLIGFWTVEQKLTFDNVQDMPKNLLNEYYAIKKQKKRALKEKNKGFDRKIRSERDVKFVETY